MQKPEIEFENGTLRAQIHEEHQFVNVLRDENTRHDFEMLGVAGQSEESEDCSGTYGQGKEGSVEVQEGDVVAVSWENTSDEVEQRYYLVEDMELVELQEPREAELKLLGRDQKLRREVFYGLDAFEGDPASPAPPAHPTDSSADAAGSAE